MMPMRCAWQELLHILPPWLQKILDLDKKDRLLELRLRRGQPPELILTERCVFLERTVLPEDLSFVVNAASNYSPWSAATVSQGYITAPGGHRIGVCGEAVVENGVLRSLRNIRSVCIRVARDHTGIAVGIPESGSVLILGAPGAGKTTLLRDLIRQRSDQGTRSIAVVDERGELFPNGFEQGRRVDILSGCGKREGIPLLLRTMGPGTIAVDEITEEADADALCSAGHCGVALLATAHGTSAKDLQCRTVYRKLLGQGMFQHYIILQEDKSWRMERISL